MTAAATDVAPAPACASHAEDVGLIASSKRRGAGEASADAAAALIVKRQRTTPDPFPGGDQAREQDQGPGCAAQEHVPKHWTQEQDQQRHVAQPEQQAPQQQAVPARPRTPLGTILTPVIYLLHGTHQLAQQFGAMPMPAQAPQHPDQDRHQHEPPRAAAWLQPGAQQLVLQQQATQQQVHKQQQAAVACAMSSNSTATGGGAAAEPSDSFVDPGDAAIATVPASARSAGPRAAAVPGPAESASCDSDCEPSGAVAACGAVPSPSASEAGSGAAGAVAAGGGPDSPSGCAMDDEEDEEWFDPLLFISRLPPAAPPAALAGRPPGALLPRRTRTCKQKTLVLDLDETLVHSTLDDAPGAEGAHFHFPVLFNGAEHMVHVRTRPHMRRFLERAAELFEVVVFTASQRVYAERLLNILDPARRLIRHRIYRDSCVYVDGNYLKDLSGLGRDLAHTAIVDNSPQAFGFQVDNGIPIESWYDDTADTELLTLMPLLEQLADADDVRPVLRERFRLRERVAGAAATWRHRMERDAAAAAVWQRQACAAAAAAAGVGHAGGSSGAMMQQTVPLGQLRAAAAAAAAAAASSGGGALPPGA